MAKSNCKNCGIEFLYDAESGVNVKFFETVADRRGFQLGGDFPVCPNCETKCRTEAAIQYENSKMTVSYKYIPVTHRRLK